MSSLAKKKAELRLRYIDVLARLDPEQRGELLPYGSVELNRRMRHAMLRSLRRRIPMDIVAFAESLTLPKEVSPTNPGKLVLTQFQKEMLWASVDADAKTIVIPKSVQVGTRWSR
jgi:hypothetical protein